MANVFYIPHGKVPSRGLFNRAMLEAKSPNHPLRFRNDSRVGTTELSASQFYNELVKAKNEGTAESLEWVRRHLFFISIFWEQANVSETSAK